MDQSTLRALRETQNKTDTKGRKRGNQKNYGEEKVGQKEEEKQKGEQRKREQAIQKLKEDREKKKAERENKKGGLLKTSERQRNRNMK
jgi:hypothetical protein